jgi:hypothetical protein
MPSDPLGGQALSYDQDLALGRETVRGCWPPDDSPMRRPRPRIFMQQAGTSELDAWQVQLCCDGDDPAPRAAMDAAHVSWVHIRYAELTATVASFGGRGTAPRCCVRVQRARGLLMVVLAIAHLQRAREAPVRGMCTNTAGEDEDWTMTGSPPQAGRRPLANRAATRLDTSLRCSHSSGRSGCSSDRPREHAGQ